MPLRFADSLVFKALKFFLLIIGFIGCFALIINYYLANNSIQLRSLTQIEELLNTIEPSAQISAYLNDKSMAREIGRGLIKSPAISRVSLINSDGLTLVALSRGRRQTATDTVVKRPLYSPFDSSVAVGELSVVLDSNQLNQKRFNYLMSVLLPIVLQTLAVTIAIIWTGMAVLLPKLKLFLNDIERLDVHQGQRLKTENYHMGSEIARVGEYINGLIGRMYQALERERSAREESELQHRQMAAILENSRTGIFVADCSGKLLSFNQACQTISRRHGNLLTPGSSISDMLASAQKTTENQILQSLGQSQKLQVEVFLPANNGHREIWLQLNLTPIDDATAQGVINDISALKSESIAAQTLARTDALTQLGNRLGFESEFSRRIANVNAGKQSLTVMSIDLDRFKAVNDDYGHDAGDQVLVYVAHQLKQITRTVDYICRWGGDEFIILLDDLDPSMSAKLASRIVEKLNEAIVLAPNQSVHIGASIGVVYAHIGEPVLSDDLLRKADKTMYQVKHGGRNNFAVVNFFEPTENR